MFENSSTKPRQKVYSNYIVVVLYSSGVICINPQSLRANCNFDKRDEYQCQITQHKSKQRLMNGGKNSG